MKKYKLNKNGYILLSIIVVIISLFFLLLQNNKIVINGSSNIFVSLNSKYSDEGAKLLVDNVDKSELLEVINNVNTNSIGKYEVIYKYKNKKEIRIVNVIDDVKPELFLNGQDSIITYLNYPYYEFGATAIDNSNGDLSQKINIINSVDVTKEGSYDVRYSVTDNSNNTKEISRKVKVLSLNNGFKQYENISNKTIDWGFSSNKTGVRPYESYAKFFNSYNAYHLGPNEKKVYFTFDEGGNPVTYVKEIADILNKYNIKGMFFVCYNYMKDNPDLIKSLLEHGHVIGNHTVLHKNMNSLAITDKFKDFINEIKLVEEEYKNITGEDMPKLFRYPNGVYSERTLSILKDMGYKSYFWSFYYNDWEKTTTKEYSLSLMKERLHNGAIYLIHPKNKGNYEALEDFILYLKEQGYEVDIATNIKKS